MYLLKKDLEGYTLKGELISGRQNYGFLLFPSFDKVCIAPQK